MPKQLEAKISFVFAQVNSFFKMIAVALVKIDLINGDHIEFFYSHEHVFKLVALGFLCNLMS